MLAMLVVATLTRISCVQTMPSHNNEFDTHVLKVFSEDDMTPDFRELLGSQDTQEGDLKKQTQARDEKFETTTLEDSTAITEKPVNISLPVHQSSEETQQQDKKMPNPNDEVDVVDREDHVTQYLSDLLVNTDSEITSLQATETEDDREGIESGETL